MMEGASLYVVSVAVSVFVSLPTHIYAYTDHGRRNVKLVVRAPVLSNLQFDLTLRYMIPRLMTHVQHDSKGQT